jgi:hypothetical protein
VRQGGFTGLLVNAVTKSGTNDFTGSAFYYFRDQTITRKQAYLNDFRQAQYGFSAGGPIIKDKVFFFVAPEWQAQKQPSSGPYVGAANAPVSQTEIDQVNQALSGLGINGGTGGLVSRKNPNTNIFARLDFNLPFSSRLVLRHNYVDAQQDVFGSGGSRDDPTITSQPTFALTSNLYGIRNKTNSTVGQLFTNLSSGAYNELLFSYTDISDIRSTPVTSPELTITVPRVNGNGTSKIVAGTERSSQGNELAQKILEITDNFTIPFGSHALTIGTRNQFYQPDNLFAQNRYGTWAFNSLDSLRNGIAATYSVSVPVVNGVFAPGANTRSKFKAATYSGYVQDLWQVTRNLAVNLGLRLDVPSFTDKPAENAVFFTEYGRHTSEVPSGQIQISPRLGFNWDVTGNQVNQLRGGVGVFTGPPAYVWLSNAFGNTGVFGFAQLSCSGNTASTQAPAFDAAARTNPPQKCAGATGTSASLGSAVNLIRSDFKFPQDLKASLGFDHRFEQGPLAGLTATVEALYSHALFSPFYENIALAGRQSVDRNGRVMYGVLNAGTQAATVVFKPGSKQAILDLTNSNKDYSYNISGALQKRFSDAFEGSLAYTYSQARDVQSVLNSTAGSNWGQGRDVKGEINAHDLGRSKWEQPHRIVASATYTFPTLTDLSLFYEGASGAPFDYTYSNDQNADSRTGNDLVYVPKDVYDPSEILFTGYNVATQVAQVRAQQEAFDRFINSQPCLRNQRGRIMSRTSCRAPWNNLVNVAVRQSLKSFGSQRASVQLDVFNFLNMLNQNWGLNRQSVSPGLPGTFLLTKSGIVNQGTANAQSVFTFNTATTRFSTQRAESNYRMQLSLRYAF